MTYPQGQYQQYPPQQSQQQYQQYPPQQYPPQQFAGYQQPVQYQYSPQQQFAVPQQQYGVPQQLQQQPQQQQQYYQSLDPSAAYKPIQPIAQAPQPNVPVIGAGNQANGAHHGAHHHKHHHKKSHDGSHAQAGQFDSNGGAHGPASKSHANKQKNKKSKSRATPPPVIPHGVNYRPARIQSINSEQEVILKQGWAYMLKYWGYELSIDAEDLPFKECYVSSSSTENYQYQGSFHELVRTSTRGSVNSSSSNKTSGTSGTKKKRGLFGGKAKAPAAAPKPPPNSKRMKQIQTRSSFEVYEPVTEPSRSYIDVYRHYFHPSFHFDKEAVYESDDDEDYGYGDNESQLSLESFVTAETSLTDPDDLSLISGPTSGKEYRRQNGFYNGNGTNGKKKHAPVKVEAQPSLLPVFSQYSPRDLHTSFITSIRQDLVDNFTLRFVRARKWETEPAIGMLCKSLNWRINEMKPNDWFFESDGPSYINGTNKGFVKNFTTEKSWIKGWDCNHNPVFMFQAKKHFGADSPLNETQRYALLTIEWVRLFLREVKDSVDQCTIVFDLTGFTLKNADYATIKFLADVFEAHYPETLGSILVHNAPWIFSTVWNIIKNWLDPVVASKIHFTKDIKELSKFIDPRFIPDYLGGEDDSTGYYPVPTEAHCKPPKEKDEHYHKLLKERDSLVLRFFETTKKWIESTNPSVSDRYLQDKISLNIELSNNYIELDPYVRNLGIYDRLGNLTIDN
ncbi:hypothetical protein G9P44_003074 [Scheffersomyces stipitis]|nr:hypothetical protein G9P44_003074 [Scheffersomyces stipitis]